MQRKSEVADKGQDWWLSLCPCTKDAAADNDSDDVASLFLDRRNPLILVCWICRGNTRKPECIVVVMLNIFVEVDRIILHGVDLADALKLKVVWLKTVKIDTNDGAGV